MGSSVVYTWTCDKCGVNLNNEHGMLPANWRYASLTLHCYRECTDPVATHKYIVCGACSTSHGYKDDKSTVLLSLFRWIFGK